MTDITDLVENDDSLSAAEKETTITMYGDEKQYRITSEKKTVVKSLLDHDHFELLWARIYHPDVGPTETKDIATLHDADAIYAVSGLMPIGCLTVKSKPRADNNQSGIVNSETIDSEVFNS